VLAVLQDPTPAHCVKLVQRGVRDILSPADLQPEVLGRCLRLAIERKQLDDTARRAYSIDLSTGLPNRQQLQEHMTHLLALREREPAAMALIALQLEGMPAVEASLGAEAANVLRRKLAVRLRASLRASDVVASLGDLFCVLLAWIDAQEDAERVARKLLQTVSQPYLVAGQTLPLSARLGVAQYPAHGKEARALLSRALGQVSGDGIGRQLRGAAANDEVPPAAD
jgi:diguanylate cyclase (GGDEF)-like protein